MTAFSVKQKHEGLSGKPAVAVIRYMQINAFGKEYKLLRKKKGKHYFTIDKVDTSAPYRDDNNGVFVNVAGNKLIYSTKFGLTVTWDGKNKGRFKIYLNI